MAGRTVLVTGASSGLGAGFARAFAARGDRLILTARREQRLRELAAEIGGEVVPCDLAERDGPARLVAEIGRRGMSVDVLVNNAGFGVWGRFADVPLEQHLAMADVMARAPTELIGRLLPGMVERGRGAILNVSSITAFHPGPLMAVYFASKAYLLSLSEALHEELKGSGVSVTAVCPGPTRTEFTDKAGVGDNKAFAALAGDPERVVRAAMEALDRNRAVAVPGLAPKLLAQLHRIAPRALSRRLVRRLQRMRG